MANSTSLGSGSPLSATRVASIILDEVAAPRVVADDPQPKMQIVYPAAGGLTTNSTFVVPYAPQEIEMANLNAGWSQIDRPGRAPILVPTGRQLPSVSFEFTIWDDGAPVDDVIQRLRNVAGDPNVWVLIFGFPALEQFSVVAQWRITALSVTIAKLGAGNVTTMARAAMTLTARNDAQIRIGPTGQPYTPVALADQALGPKIDPTAPKTPAPKPGDPTFQGPIKPAPKPGAPDFVGPIKPAPTPRLDPPKIDNTGAFQSGIAVGFRNPATTEEARTANGIAWIGICRRLGIPTANASKVAVAAGYTFQTGPELGTIITVTSPNGVKIRLRSETQIGI